MPTLSSLVHLQRKARRNALYASRRLRQQRLEADIAQQALPSGAPYADVAGTDDHGAARTESP